MQIAIPIYPAFTALDAIGPYEVLQRLPGAEVVFCSERAEVVRTEQGMLGISADSTLDQLDRPDIVVVPGGVGDEVPARSGRPVRELDRPGPRDDHLDDVRLHRLAAARRRRRPRRGRCDHPLGSAGPARRARRQPGGRAGRREGQGGHRRRRLVRHRHGVATGRAGGRPGGCAGPAAGDRVRPRSTPRHGIAGEGAAGDRRADGHRPGRGGRSRGRAALAGRAIGRETLAREPGPDAATHLQRHPADRAQAPRQLHRRDPPVRRGPGARRRRRRRSTASSICTRSPSPTTRPSCESGFYDTTAILLAAGLDPDRCILFRQGDVREHTELCWLLGGGHRPGRSQPHAPVKVKEQVGAAGRARLRRPLQLPDPAGRRRARLPGHRGAGRRRPAPAHRADARRRPPLQRAFRPDPRRARAPDPRGRRPDHGPPGPDHEDVDHRRRRGRARSTSSTSPTRISKKFKQRRHRLRPRGPAAAGGQGRGSRT